MGEMPWVRFFPSDWLGGTRSMSAAETGIYITLIATMYERGEPIPEDHTRLARLCGASNSSFKSCLESLIGDGKVTRTDAGLWNNRVEKEVVYRMEKSEVGSRAAKIKWDRKRNENKDNADAPAMPSQSDRNANQKPEPDTRKKEVILSPQVAPKLKNGSRLSEDWVLPKAWGDWALESVSGATIETVRSQAEQFRDYWVGKAGAAARKVDWEATWRNWMRNAKPIHRAYPPNLDGKPRNIAEASTQLLAQMRAENANTQPGTSNSIPQSNVPRLTPPIRKFGSE